MTDTAREILNEYVKTAETMLQQEYGKNYTPETLEKLSMVLITRDRDDAMRKEAEEVIYTSFADELSKLGIEPLPVLKALAKE